jgi:hypothetical protein
MIKDSIWLRSLDVIFYSCPVLKDQYATSLEWNTAEILHQLSLQYALSKHLLSPRQTGGVMAERSTRAWEVAGEGASAPLTD